MKRKTLAALVAVMGLFLFGQRALADNVSDRVTDIETWEVGGASNTVVAISSVGQIVAQDGVTTNHETCQMVLSVSTNAVFKTPDLSTTSLVAGDTTYTVGFTQPPYPHGLTLSLWITGIPAVVSARAISTATVVGTTARGDTVREIVYVSTALTKTNNAFATISSVTFSAVTTVPVNSANLNYYIGSTTTFGLAGHIETTDDVVKTRAWGVNATSITYSPSFETLIYPTQSNPSTFDSWYRNTRSAPPRPK